MKLSQFDEAAGMVLALRTARRLKEHLKSGATSVFINAGSRDVTEIPAAVAVQLLDAWEEKASHVLLFTHGIWDDPERPAPTPVTLVPVEPPTVQRTRPSRSEIVDATLTDVRLWELVKVAQDDNAVELPPIDAGAVAALRNEPRHSTPTTLSPSEQSDWTAGWELANAWNHEAPEARKTDVVDAHREIEF